MTGNPWSGGQPVNGRELLMDIQERLDVPEFVDDTIIDIQRHIVGDGGHLLFSFTSGRTYKVTVEQA